MRKCLKKLADADTCIKLINKLADFCFGELLKTQNHTPVFLQRAFVTVRFAVARMELGVNEFLFPNDASPGTSLSSLLTDVAHFCFPK